MTAKIIPFPIRELNPAPAPETKVDPEQDRINEVITRSKEIEPVVKKIVNRYLAKKFSVLIFVTDAKKVDITAAAIRTLESRLMVHSFHRTGPRSRNYSYRYPVFHVLVMSHQNFLHDKNALTHFIAANKRAMIVSDGKKREIPKAMSMLLKDFK